MPIHSGYYLWITPVPAVYRQGGGIPFTANFSSSKDMQGVPLSTQAALTCRLYLFHHQKHEHAGYIPFCYQQYERGGCTPFHTQQYGRAGCTPLQHKHFWCAGCTPYHNCIDVQGVPLSTSSNVNDCWQCGHFHTRKVFWNARISDCPASSLFSTGMNKMPMLEPSLVLEQWDPVCYWHAPVPDGDTGLPKTYAGSIARDADAQQWLVLWSTVLWHPNNTHIWLTL